MQMMTLMDNMKQQSFELDTAQLTAKWSKGNARVEQTGQRLDVIKKGKYDTMVGRKMLS
jgi:hypothetical protein